MHEYRVEKVNCGGCARRLTLAVRALDNQAKVEVDIAAKRVRVDSALPPDLVVSTISRAGYPAEKL